MNKTVLVFNYKKINRYSIAALIGSLEIDNRFNNLNIRLVKDREDFPQVLSNLISNFQKIIVAFSFMTPEAFNMHNLIQKLKSKKSNNVIFVAGGSHPSGDFKGTLKMGFDIVIIGEGEKTFPELLFRIMNNQTYTDIKGIAYKKDEKVIFTGPDEPINLDLYPPFAEKHKLFSPIEITRGCTFGCKFCQTTFLFKGIRHRSVPNVCKYVKIMMSEKLTDIRFITPNAFSYGSSDGKKLNLEAIENLLKSIRDIIKNKGRIFFGTFPSEVRPEFVNEETIRLIKTYTNNDNLVIGAQSGSPRILKECKRGHTIDDIYKAVELTLEAGLKVNVDFIFGLPKETQEDKRLTYDVIKDLISMGARIHGHVFIPLAGTPYKNAPSTKLNEDDKKFLDKLVSQGKLYGNWKEQEKIAESIIKYFQKQF